jgi:hypothetical protein
MSEGLPTDDQMWVNVSELIHNRAADRRVAHAFDLAGTTKTAGAPSFAHLAKGGYHERIGNGFCADQGSEEGRHGCFISL